MSYSGPPSKYGPPEGYGAPGGYGPPAPAATPSPSRQGRSGPPLWLGLVVMMLGPMVFAAALGWVVVSSLDLAGATSPVPNPTVLTAQGGSTYVVFSESSQKPCSILRDTGSKEPLASAEATENLTVDGTTYLSRGGFTTDTTAAVRVECPKSGPELLVVGVQTEGLGLKIALLALAALGSFVIGLLMVIFRRRAPRY